MSGSRSGRDESSCPSLTKVVPSSSSALRNCSAASRVAGRPPVTPISRRTRISFRRRATRATSIALLRRCALPATLRICPFALAEQPPDRRLELAYRDGPLELRLDPAVTADDERPRLRSEAPLAHPAVVAERGAVVREDLDVDEADAGPLESSPHVVDDVDDWTARSARAVARRRKGDDERLVSGQRRGDRV